MAKKFTQQEMEKLIAGIREAYDIKIRQLNYRLDGLTAENRSLRASIAEYKEREGRVGRAIVDAEEKGEEIREFYRASAEAEWKTLRLFADKWKSLAAQMADVLPKEAKKYGDLAGDLAALLGREAGRFAGRGNAADDAAAASAARTGAQTPPEKFDPQAVIGRYMESEEEETGFNLDDVLNPKGDLDLAKLCKNLGLMDEDEGDI